MCVMRRMLESFADDYDDGSGRCFFVNVKCRVKRDERWMWMKMKQGPACAASFVVPAGGGDATGRL